MKPVLVVGAGFAGATYARVIADAGIPVTVIDRRPHVAGTAFDYLNDEGIRIHKYGGHFIHTSNARVFRWLSRFCQWHPYIHTATAKIGASYVPIPINMNTINAIFCTKLTNEEETREFLFKVRINRDKIANAEDYLLNSIGTVLSDLFFRPYVQKMWGLDLTDLHPSVVRRVAARSSQESRYWPKDKYQVTPKGGYSQLVSNILQHELIDVVLDCPFDIAMTKDFVHCFTCMSADEFFDMRHGPLPFRSIKFHQEELARPLARPSCVVVYTDDGPFIRETHWNLLPENRAVQAQRSTTTIEEPCPHEENPGESYYPIKLSDRKYQRLNNKYLALADFIDSITFIGRCGTYQYLDIDQVVNQSLIGAARWLQASPGPRFNRLSEVVVRPGGDRGLGTNPSEDRASVAI